MAGPENDYFLVEGRAFIVGGTGDDWIETRGEATVVAFNPGDGPRHGVSRRAVPFALSLGGRRGPGGPLPARGRRGRHPLCSQAATRFRLTRQLEADPYAWPPITAQLFGSVHTYDFNAVARSTFIAGPIPRVTFALDGVLAKTI